MKSKFNSGTKLFYTHLCNRHAIVREGAGYPSERPHRGIQILSNTSVKVIQTILVWLLIRLVLATQIPTNL